MKEETNAAMERCMKDWEDLSSEYLDLEELHKSYRQKLEETLSLQKKVNSGVKHQRYRLGAIQKMMSDVNGTLDDEQLNHKNDLKKDVLRRKAQLSQMEDYLPQESGRYLKVILGNLNVSIIDKDAKSNYKEQYEQFKLTVNIIATITATVSLFVENIVLDRLYLFLVLWYYCTLTIRESILRVNGSRIKGWWRAHHFVSTILAGVLLVWPNGECFQAFRTHFLYFGIYLGFVSYVQFTYQRGCLYRLKSLGVRNNDMDITIDGFHSWMWKGLSFLLPFLGICYVWQLYHSYTLYNLSLREDAEWQVAVLSFLFLVIGMGNIITTTWTMTAKIRDRQKGYFKFRFTRLDKYFWTHKRRGPESRIVKSYSRGAERIRTKSISGRHSPYLSEMRKAHKTSAHPEPLEEQITSTAADDSPDHQILMAPRNPKQLPGIDATNETAQSEDSSSDTKKDI